MRAVVIAIGTSLIAMSATAEQATIVPPREDDGSIAWLIHDNELTMGVGGSEEPFSLEVEGYGAIVGVIVRTQNNLCVPSCPDTLTIVDVPDGLAVVPPGVTTAERTMSVLRVYELLGM